MKEYQACPFCKKDGRKRDNNEIVYGERNDINEEVAAYFFCEHRKCMYAWR